MARILLTSGDPNWHFCEVHVCKKCDFRRSEPSIEAEWDALMASRCTKLGDSHTCKSCGTGAPNCCGSDGSEHWFGCPNEGDTNDHIYNNPDKLINVLETQIHFEVGRE